MNKTELVAAIAERTELTKKDADQALKAFIDVVGDELSKGEKIQLAGFGTFEVTERKATTGVGESESKRGFLTSFSHSKPCMRLSSRTAPK